MRKYIIKAITLCGIAILVSNHANANDLIDSLTKYCVTSNCFDKATWNGTNCTCGMGKYYHKSVRFCKKCEAGTFSNISTAITCTPCPANQYQPEMEKSSCLPCGENVATCDPINGFIISCVSGYSVKNGRCERIQCPAGSYGLTIINNQCPAGTYGMTIASPQSCQPGSYNHTY